MSPAERAPADEHVSRGKVWTVRGLLSTAAEYLATRGVDSARLDAERMLARTLGTERLELYLEPERAVSDEERSRLRDLVRRRAGREPAQYVLGTAEFYGLDFTSDPRAAIPRRETELLVDRALEAAGGRPVNALDLGTGSGCIAASLAKNLPDGSRVWATDISSEALALARENLAALGLADRVELRAGDLFDALGGKGEPGEQKGSSISIAFDLIVANLPYVETGAFSGLQPEVREHEPRAALDGGPDGLDVITRAVAAAPSHMAPGGWLLLEVGLGQAGDVTSLIEGAGLSPGPALKDAANIDRVVQGQRPA